MEGPPQQQVQPRVHRVASNVVPLWRRRPPRFNSSQVLTIPEFINLRIFITIFSLFWSSKGQIISEQNYGVLNFPKMQQNYC